jgi:DNA-binding NarL/FixJ family response regulator
MIGMQGIAPARIGALMTSSPRFPQDHSPPEQHATGEPKKAASRLRVLVVEDDFLIAMQSESALRDAGFEVVGPATTAEEAIALALAERPALAVMDIRLASKRDGIEAAGELFHELGIRCIFATAHDDAHTRQRAEPYAPLGWLAKPYSMASLIVLVAESFSNLD